MQGEDNHILPKFQGQAKMVLFFSHAIFIGKVQLTHVNSLQPSVIWQLYDMGREFLVNQNILHIY